MILRLLPIKPVIQGKIIKILGWGNYNPVNLLIKLWNSGQKWPKRA
jgi:hypothetical protein